MIAYPVDLMLAARTASSWTASRMSMAHPTLTRIYLATATVLLLAIQLPLLLYALASREKGHSAIVIAALLIFGTALVNAILYAVGNGLQNVRYALPAYVLVYSAVVWANAAVLGDLQRGVRRDNPPLGRTERTGPVATAVASAPSKLRLRWFALDLRCGPYHNWADLSISVAPSPRIGSSGPRRGRGERTRVDRGWRGC